MAKLRRVAVLLICLLSVKSAFAQGTCPANVPATGNHCYFMAANGADTNSGTSESSPWLHAPGMPNCSANCAAITPAPGNGFIFRGGDTWHFGNSSASPFTGGTWNWTYWNGSGTNCDTTDNPTPIRTSCIYIGVDPTWYSGSSWARPIMTGDNPASTTAVSRCAFPNVGTKDQFLLVQASFVWVDNFEWTGMCSQTASSSSNNYLLGYDLYIWDLGCCGKMIQNIYSNNYAHGWTHVPFSCSEPGGEPIGICESGGFISGGTSLSVLGPGNVCDGWDSDPTDVGCVGIGPAYIVYDNVFGNFAQIVVNSYHNWHDNYWFNYHPTGDGVAHGNEWEANTDAPGSDSNGNPQPTVPFNAWYNNVQGHTASTALGDMKVAFCPNTTAAEYWFNNIQYDQAGTGNTWDVATAGFNCTASGHIFMFNNTLDSPGAGALNCVGGMTVTGNHEIVEGSSAFGSGACTISNEIKMTHATAVSQGYMATGKGTSGSNSNTTCANDATPCAPTAATNSTVGAGPNLQGYCTALLRSSAPEIVRAGNACLYGTTDSCSYDSTTHTVICPRNGLVGRAASAAWDAGAYLFTGSPLQAPVPPTKLLATVQ